MNIDDEIEKLNKERDVLLIEVVKTRNTINKLARKIRSLETVKRHASEILEGTAKVLMISGDGPGVEDEFKDPAQLDLETDNSTDDLTPVEEALGGVNVVSAELRGLKYGDTLPKPEESKTKFEKAVEQVANATEAIKEIVAKVKGEKSPSIIDSQIKDAIRNGEDPYVKYTGLVKESHIKKMADEVIAENVAASLADKALEVRNAVDEFLNS